MTADAIFQCEICGFSHVRVDLSCNEARLVWEMARTVAEWIPDRTPARMSKLIDEVADVVRRNRP